MQIQLASLFLQLRLSERSGRGVPKIVGAYGRESIRIERNFIVVTIPFNRINVTPFELNEGKDAENRTIKPTLNPTLNPTLRLTKAQNLILEEISKNPDITQAELASMLKYQRSSISESMSKLQKLGILKRIAGKKNGYWEIINHDEV